jgi:hypothetical protein
MLKIPVKQNSNCGGQYKTVTSFSTGYVYCSQWQTPESWEENVIPDGCTKILVKDRIIIPPHSKVLHYQ